MSVNMMMKACISSSSWQSMLEPWERFSVNASAMLCEGRHHSCPDIINIIWGFLVHSLCPVACWYGYAPTYILLVNDIDRTSGEVAHIIVIWAVIHVTSFPSKSGHMTCPGGQTLHKIHDQLDLWHGGTMVWYMGELVVTHLVLRLGGRSCLVVGNGTCLIGVINQGLENLWKKVGAEVKKGLSSLHGL